MPVRKLRFRTGPRSRNCRGFSRCSRSHSRIRGRIFRLRTAARSRNCSGFLRCSRNHSWLRCRIFRFRTGARSRNSHGFLRCSRSYSRIQGSVPVLGLQLNEFSRSLLVCARTHPPVSTHTKVRVSFCLLGKWYGKVVFRSRWDEVANSA